MRVARCSSIGILTHVGCEFVDKRWMLTDDVERRMYLEYFGRAIKATDWLCIAYCLMSNHLHFGLIPGRDDLERWAKAVNSPFAQWLNHRHGRHGPVFADRPDEWVVRSSAAHLIAYIHNNPIRAKVAATASETTWTSHRAYVGLDERPSWLHVEAGLELAGFAGNPSAFDTFVSSCPSRHPKHPDLAAIRASVRKREALEVGTPTLTEDGFDVPLLRARDAIVPVDPLEILSRTLDALNVPEREVCSRSCRREPSSAKRVFVHAALRLGRTGSECARILGVSPQAVSRHAKKPLDAAHRAVVDSLVDELATTYRAQAQASPLPELLPGA